MEPLTLTMGKKQFELFKMLTESKFIIFINDAFENMLKKSGTNFFYK